jgi:hypothetical protein
MASLRTIIFPVSWPIIPRRPAKQMCRELAGEFSELHIPLRALRDRVLLPGIMRERYAMADLPHRTTLATIAQHARQVRAVPARPYNIHATPLWNLHKQRAEIRSAEELSANRLPGCEWSFGLGKILQ